MQGIHYGVHHSEVDNCPLTVLVDLAGNAWHAGCSACAILSLLVALARSFDSHLSSQRKAQVRAAVEKPSESGSVTASDALQQMDALMRRPPS